METVLSNELISEYLANHQRRRAFLRYCNLDVLRQLVADTQVIIDAKEEEELARMEVEEKKKNAIAGATRELLELGVTPEELVEALSCSKVGSPASKIKQTAFKRPDTGEIVRWSRRGQVPKALRDLYEIHGRHGLEQFIVEE
ncbi:TPA: hypothetical protein RQO57_003591 [Aeromonas dhakensis]|uniref:H-NS family histone-like protein n=1 Tax=Aeromonas dhakensis TaxID=196024 RepID=UPI00288D9004|nr:hypothetical protein [Aeromonas dhakensis]